MIRVFWPLYLLMVLLSLSTSYTGIVQSLRYDAYADAFFLGWEALRAGKAMWADTVTYSAYLEVNRVFPAPLYADQAEEVWIVPDYFVDPPGGGTAECNGLGCTIWNLSDAGGPSYSTNPCPDVLTYSPNPDPISALQLSTEAGFAWYLSQISKEAEGRMDEAIKWAGRGDFRLVPTSYALERTAAGIRVSGSADIAYSSLVEGNAAADVNADFNVEYRSLTASCVCRNVNTGNDETLATYDVNEAVIHVYAWNPDSGKVYTDRGFPYIRWFAARTWAASVDPTNYTSCRMVFG